MPVFISHAKKDGVELAADFRRHITADTQLAKFFDANEIRYGDDFTSVIATAAAGAALLVIQSDAYATRDWCRFEVLAAKAAERPVLVVQAMERGERREAGAGDRRAGLHGPIVADHKPVDGPYPSLGAQCMLEARAPARHSRGRCDEPPKNCPGDGNGRRHRDGGDGSSGGSYTVHHTGRVPRRRHRD